MAGFLANLGATEAVARARELEAHGKQTDLSHGSELYQEVERSARCWRGCRPGAAWIWQTDGRTWEAASD